MTTETASARAKRLRYEPIVIVWTCPAGTLHKQPLRLPRAQACAAVLSLLLRLSRASVQA